MSTHLNLDSKKWGSVLDYITGFLIHILVFFWRLNGSNLTLTLSHSRHILFSCSLSSFVILKFIDWRTEKNADEILMRYKGSKDEW